ncbi:BolA family protein [Coxiella endosymbiont of Amblyomma nuttalli]|uniref:BolA family protein n=1 Tax=Coxiella endosymbiont of Amblyomma nuttalli TaxID=2749996 RepID=UPI001BA62233|nr:BolA family protein [Coxiella endosymbiont of Amblyomma nuttalli]QTS84066.1 DNA-binding transcriptional regulator BolA [Coxiella endosymbiont of Amblyomma nuttalli]
MKEKRLTQIKEQLSNILHPEKLIVTDESHYHQGHPGAKEGKGHFTIVIVAKAFNNKSLLERHRIVYEVLDSLIQTDIHALKIHAIDAS